MHAKPHNQWNRQSVASLFCILWNYTSYVSRNLTINFSFEAILCGTSCDMSSIRPIGKRVALKYVSTDCVWTFSFSSPTPQQALLSPPSFPVMTARSNHVPFIRTCTCYPSCCGHFVWKFLLCPHPCHDLGCRWRWVELFWSSFHDTHAPTHTHTIKWRAE